MEHQINENSSEILLRKYALTKASDLILELENQGDEQEIWNGIYQGSKGLIVGVAKTGKTTLAENLAISIAVGRDEFFGFPILSKPQKVLFINFEESSRVRTRRTKKQISQLSELELNLFNENFISTPSNFLEFVHDEKDWKDLSEYVDYADCDIIIIDSLSHMVNGAIEKSSNFLEFVQLFRSYLSSKQKTIIVIHHNVKGNDRPMTQDSIAGSRVVTQEFEYAIGLSNIASSTEKYLTTLYSKYEETDTSMVTTYKITSNKWIENIAFADVTDFYGTSTAKIDFRNDITNRELIFEYISSMYSKDSKAVETQDLLECFVNGGIMSKPTLYTQLKSLVESKRIEKPKTGKYQPIIISENV